MKIAKNTSNEILPEKGLEDLHFESLRWVSDITLWKIELNFFQKLLDKYGPEFDSIDQKKEIDHFQNLLTYYNGELLDEFKQLVRRHENNLAKEFAIDGKVNETLYRDQHQKLGSRIHAFDHEFKAYKKEFFSFIEKVF